mgnify:CR=1 FL=1
MSVLGKRSATHLEHSATILGKRRADHEHAIRKRGRTHEQRLQQADTDVFEKIGSKRKGIDLAQEHQKRARTIHANGHHSTALRGEVRECSRQLAHAHAEYTRVYEMSKKRLVIAVEAKKELEVYKIKVRGLMQMFQSLNRQIRVLQEQNRSLERKNELCREHIRLVTGLAPFPEKNRLIY